MQKSLLFLSEVLDGLTKTIYFQRYYLYILLKSFVQYYFVNLENGIFPDLTFKYVENYSQLIKVSLLNNQIAPNEEIFLFFKNFLSNEKIKNDKNHQKDIKNNFVFHIDEENEEINLKNIEKNIDIVKNVIEKKDEKLIFNYNNIKVECNILNEEALYYGIYTIHDDYFTSFNCDIKKLNIETIIEIIINAINYLINKEYNDGKKYYKNNDKKDENIKDKKMAFFLIDLAIELKKLENEINKYKKINNIQDIEEDKKDNKEKNINNKININSNNNTIKNTNQNNKKNFNIKSSFRVNHHNEVGSINDVNDELSRSHSFIDDFVDIHIIKNNLKNNNKNKK